MPRRVLRYGVAASGTVEAWLPTTAASLDAVPVAVLLHGGYWRDRYRRGLMDPLAPEMATVGVPSLCAG